MSQPIPSVNNPPPTLPSPAQATKFLLFSKLPLELQDEIWKFSMVPRFVHWRAGGKAPALLTACPESRGFAKPKYKFCTSGDYHAGQDKAEDEFGVWINCDLDILYCRQLPFPYRWDAVSRQFIRSSSMWWMKGITHLIVSMGPMQFRGYHTGEGGSFFWQILRLLYPDLKELMFAVTWGRLGEHVVLDDLAETNVPNGSEAHEMNIFIQETREMKEKGWFPNMKLRFCLVSRDMLAN